MSTLTELKCEACRSDATRLTESETKELIRQIPDWEIVEHEGVPRLQRVYKFPDFARAIQFTDEVAALAEEADHHPSLLTEWGRVTVSWWSHKIKGLHRNDFIMAARSDDAYEGRVETNGH